MKRLQPLSIIDECEMKREGTVMAFDGATNGSRDEGWCPRVGKYYKGQLIMERIPQRYLNYYKDEDRKYIKKFATSHFEMLAIIVGLWHFRKQFNSKQIILLRIDNEKVESMLITKHSADLVLADAIRWICMFARDSKIRFYIKYIHTKVNKIPDALNRFNKEEALREVKKTRFSPSWCREVKFPWINIW